jgi:hypothetical protein
VLNQIVLDNTTHSPLVAAASAASTSRKNAFVEAFVSWRALLKNRALNDTLLLNLAYWVTLAGTQFTLLPLFMVNTLNLGPSQIGLCFAALSVVAVRYCLFAFFLTIFLGDFFAAACLGCGSVWEASCADCGLGAVELRNGADPNGNVV